MEKRKIYIKSRYTLPEDYLENWIAINPVLERGEPSIVRNPQNESEWLKFGDGVTAWVDLPYKVGPQGLTGEKGDKGDKGDTGEPGPQGIEGEPGKDAVTDQIYDPTSENAQSGKAVAEGLSQTFGVANTLLDELVDGTTNTNFFDIATNGELSIKADYFPNGSKYNELPNLLVIPDIVDNISVSSLVANFLKENRNVKAVVLPTTLTAIPNSAFEGTNIEYVYGLEHITSIGERAFYEGGLKAANLTSILDNQIGNYAFFRCYRLEKVILNDVITILPIGCFCRCIRLSTILGGSSINKFMDGCLSNTDTLTNAECIIATLSGSNPITLGKSAFVWTALPFDWSLRDYANDIFVTSGSSVLTAELDATAYQKWNGGNRGLYASWQSAKSGLTDYSSNMQIRTNQYYLSAVTPERNLGSYIADLVEDDGWITTASLNANGGCFFVSTSNAIMNLFNARGVEDYRDIERKLYAYSSNIDATNNVSTSLETSNTSKLKSAISSFRGSTGAARTDSYEQGYSCSIHLANALNLEWERYYLTDEDKFMYHSSRMAKNSQPPIEYEGGYSAFIENVFYQNIASGKLLTIACLSNNTNTITNGKLNGHNHVINVCGYKQNGDIEVFNNMVDKRGNEYSGFTEYIPPEQVLSYYNEYAYFWKEV